METTFEINCQKFSLINAKGAALLSFAEPGSLQLARDATGANILVDKTPKGDFFFHSPQDAKKEAANWIREQNLDDVDVLVVYGLGLGYAYFALQNWLQAKNDRKLVFLEDDIRVFIHFLEMPQAATLLDDARVQIHFIEDNEEGLYTMQSLAWGAFDKKMEVVALPLYAERRKKTFEDIKARILYESSDIHLVLDEYASYGVTYFRNFWKNLFLMPGSYKANNLQGAFRGVPAIVVGAGPSLGQHLEMLKDLKETALIFAGGSSVNALLDAKIVPHFGAGIDPNPLQYLRIRQNVAFQVPYFFRHRLLHESLRLISGPRLYLKGGDGYNISDWFERKLHLRGPIIGGGHSVANFIVEIAHSLGCSPIILVGYDLAYGKELETYAPGVTLGHPEIKKSVKYEPQDEPVLWDSNYGGKVHTAWKWLLEAKWLSNFAKDRPRVKLINATEGGLGLKDVVHMSLEEVKKRYLTTKRDLSGLVHTAIQDAGEIPNDYNTLFKTCSQVYDSLERAKLYLDQLSQIVKEAGNLESLEDPRTILLETKFKKELAYRYILEVFDRMRIKLEHYRVEFASHPTKDESDMKAHEMRLLLERYLFLKETAVVNQLLIAQSVQIQQALGRDISAFHPKSQVLWT